MPHEDIGALWGGDPSLFTPTFTPLPDSAKDIEFGGTVPEEINVRWSYSINAPKHIVWQNLMTETKDGGKDGGKFEILDEAPEGNFVTVWGKPFVSGTHALGFGVNDEILVFEPETPYKLTYYVIKTKIPAFDGLTGVIQIVEGEEKDTSRMEFAGKFSNVFPVPMIALITRHLVIGRPMAVKAEADWAENKGENYTGPTPIP